MRLAFLALALALPAASAALAPPGPPASAQHRPAANAMPSRLCDDLKVRPVRSPQAARPKRLGELPSGDLTLTVLNRVGECIEPMTVRQGYGAVGGR